MVKALTWFIVHTTLAAMLFAWFVHEIDGARNVFLFYVWTMAVVITIVLVDPAKAGRKGRSVPWWVSVPYSTLVVVFLVWHGAFATALAWCWGWAVTEWAFASAADARDIKSDD